MDSTGSARMPVVLIVVGLGGCYADSATSPAMDEDVVDLAPDYAEMNDEHGYWHCHWYADDGDDNPDPPIMTFSGSDEGVWDCHWIPEPGGWDPPGPQDPPVNTGTNYPEPQDIENDPYNYTNGSLWYDVVYGMPEQFTPNCSKAADKLHPLEVRWCQGLGPDATDQNTLAAAAAAILQRCSYLSGVWNDVQGNIRLWNWAGEPFGGGTRLGEKWILLSYEWLDQDPELGLAHELLHVASYNHATPSQKDDFRQREMECSGGRSTQ